MGNFPIIVFLSSERKITQQTNVTESFKFHFSIWYDNQKFKIVSRIIGLKIKWFYFFDCQPSACLTVYFHLNNTVGIELAGFNNCYNHNCINDRLVI